MDWIKAVLSAVLLVGVVQSVLLPGLKENKVLFYRIEGKTVTGLPQIRDQFSGFEYNGTLLIETHASNILLLQFIDMKYDIMNGDLPNGWWSDSSASTYNETKPLPLTKSAFLLLLENHFVKKVVVPRDLKDWELNFIKGFLKSFFPNFDSFKINKKDKSNYSSKSKSRPDLEDSFTVMQETVVGKCEVQYEVFRLPRNGEGWPQSSNDNMKSTVCGSNDDLFEIVRTHNYSNCEYTAETRFALPRYTAADCPPGDSKCDDVLNRASVSRIRGCSSSRGSLILDSVTSSSVSANLQLHAESKAIVSSKLNATLINSTALPPGDPSNRIGLLPKDPMHIGDFFYTYSHSVKNRSGSNCKSRRSDERQYKPKKSDDDTNKHGNGNPQDPDEDSGTVKNPSSSSQSNKNSNNHDNILMEINENGDIYNRIKKSVSKKSFRGENRGSKENDSRSYGVDNDDDDDDYNSKRKSGKNFKNNYNSREFTENEERNPFKNNDNSGEFTDNKQGRRFKNNDNSREFTDNKLGKRFKGNDNSGEFTDNKLGKRFKGNDNSGEFTDKKHGKGFKNNDNSREFTDKNQGKWFKNNDNSGEFTDNKQGKGFKNNNDNSGEFTDNKQGRRFKNNDNSREFTDNEQRNTFNINYHNREFIENEQDDVQNKRKQKNNDDDDDDERRSVKFIATAWNLHEPSMNDGYAQPLNPFTLSFRTDECVDAVLEEQVKAIATDIMAGFVSSEGALTEKIAIAIDINRMLSFEEIKSLSNLFMNSENLFERAVFRDVVSSSGSKPSLKIINEWINRDIISNEESAQILRLLPEKLMFSDKETVEFYFKIVKLVAEKGDSSLFSAAVIGFSNFVRVACFDQTSTRSRFNPEFYNQVCQQSQADEFIHWLDEKLRDDLSSFKIIVTAMGNTGSPSAISKLTKKAQDSSLSSYKRLSSVFALRYQSFQYPKLVAPQLMRLYANFSNPAPVRIAAFSLLVYTQPPVSAWQRFAVSTWFEKNIVVNNFVQTTIQSFSRNEYQAYADISKAASIVLPLMKPIANMMQMKAFNSMMASTIREIETAVFHQNSWIGLADVMSLYNRHTTSTNAFSSLFEAELTSANPDGLLTAIKDLLMLSNDVSQVRPPIADLKRSTRWIHNLLGLVARKPPQLEGDIHIRINKLVEHVHSFDRRTQISMVKWGRKMMTELLLGKLQYDHLKLDMSSTMVSTTTELGLPVRLQMRVPSITQFNASARLLQEYALNSTVEFLHSSGMNTDLSFFTPWDRNTFTSGVIGSCFVQIPTVAILHRRFGAQSELQVSSNAFEKSKIFHHSTLPFTSLRKPEQITKAYRRNTETRLVHSGVKKEKTFDLTPEINVRYRTENEMMSVARALKSIQVMGHPFLRHHSMKLNQLDVTIDELPSISFNVSFGHALKRNNEVEIHYSNVGNANQVPQNTSTVAPPVSSTAKPVTLEISEVNTTTAGTIMESVTASPDPSESDSDDSAAEANLTTTQMPPTSTTSRTVIPKPDKGFFRSVIDFFKGIFGSSKQPELPTRRVYYSTGPNMILCGSDLEIHSLTDSVDGNSFNASSLNIFNTNENPSDVLLVKVLEGLSSGSASVVNMEVAFTRSGVTEKYSTYLTIGAGSMRRIKRFGIFFRGDASSMKGGLTSTLELPLLPAYDLEAIVHEKKRPKFYVDFINHYESNKIRQLSIQGDMAYRAFNMVNSDMIDECQKPKSIAYHNCRKRYEEGTSIEKYSLNMSADDKSGLIQWLLHKTITAGAAILTGNEQYELVDDRSQPNSNNLQLDVIVDKEKKTLNSRIKMESAEVLLKKIPFPYINEPSLSMTLYTEVEQQFNSDYCGISYSGISTFDRVKVDYNLTKCWHLVTKDCSGKSRIAVLARRSLNDMDLDLEINLDNYKVINIIDGSIRINDKNVTISRSKSAAAISDEAGTQLIRIERSLDYGLFINLPAHGFHVIYTNTSAVIHASSQMQNRLCGLCGDFNLEEFGEFTTPKGSRARDSQQFGASYKIKEGDCN